MDKKFLSVEEAVALFGLNSAQLQQLVDEGELRALADRGSWKYRRDEIEQLIRDGHLTAQHPQGDGVAPSDDFSFLEIDENAMDEGTTTITPTTDFLFDSGSSSPEIIDPEAEFASDADIMMIESDPDVPTISAKPSSSDMPVASSLSEFDIVLQDSSEPQPRLVSGDSSIILEDAGDSQLDSDSDVKVVKESGDSGELTAEGTDADILTDFSSLMSGSKKSTEESSIILEDDGDSQLESDSDVKVVQDASLSNEMPAAGTDADFLADSSVLTNSDSDSHSGPDSVVRLADSGISLDSGDVDSGIMLTPDSGLALEAVDSGKMADSGIMLDSDSGLTLETSAVDSGLTLEGAADSGISLEGADSGLSLTDAESGIALSGTAQPVRAARPDDTLPEFDQFNDSGDRTGVIETFEDSAEVAPIRPVKGKQPKNPGLSDSFAMDEEVQDLEIVEDLDAGEVDYDSAAELDAVEEEVFDASDDAFSVAESGEFQEESGIASSVPVMKSVSREPSWGVVTIIPIAACAFLLLVQSLLLWDGISTMWNGDTSKALGASVIDSLSGLM